MKNQFTKQLVLLAAVFLASIGHALGYTITFNISPYANETLVNVHITGQSVTGDPIDEWIAGNNETRDFSSGDDLYMNLTWLQEFYSVESFKVDGVDQTAAFMNEGYHLSVSSDHTVDIQLTKAPTHSVSVEFSHQEVASLYFATDGYYPSRQHTSTMDFPLRETVWMYLALFSNVYELKKLTFDGNDITEEFKAKRSYAFSTMEEDHTVYVEFEEFPTHTITVTCPQNLEFDKSFFDDNSFSFSTTENENQFAAGKDVMLQFRPPTGYVIDKVTITDSDNVTTDVTEAYKQNDYYKFVQLASDYTVNVEMEEVGSNSILFHYDSGMGWIYMFNEYTSFGCEPDQEYPITTGDTYTIQVNANQEGYGLSKLEVNGEDVTDSYWVNDGYVINNVSQDYEVNVTYGQLPSVTAIYDSSQGEVSIEYFGRLVPDQPRYIKPSQTDLNLWIYANNGYEIATIKVDGVDITSQYLDSGSYTFSDTSVSHTVEVTYKETVPFYMSFDDSKGWIAFIVDENTFGVGNDPNTPFYCSYGADRMMQIYPYDGYKIASVIIDDVDVTSQYLANDGYTFYNITEEHHVNVTFEEASYYTITVDYPNADVSVYLNGSYPGDGITYVEGTKVYLNIYADNGYVPTATMDDGEPLSLTYNVEDMYYQYVFDNLDADHHVEVEYNDIGTSRVDFDFDNTQATLSLGNSNFDYPGYVYFTNDIDIRLTITPKIGYELDKLLIGDVDVTAEYLTNGSYTLDVHECTIHVVMKKKTAPANVTITMPVLGVDTYCSEYDLCFTGSNLKAYVASGYNPSTNEALLTRVYNVPAGTGILLKGNEGSYEISTTNTNYLYANMFKGIVEATYIDYSRWTYSWYGGDEYVNYLLTESDEGYCFRPSSINGEELGANKAYLLIPSKFVDDPSANSKVFMIFEDEEEEAGDIVTAVGFISAGKNRAANEDVYDLQGRKVTGKALKPGIYVRNGKKFMVK